jgi:hypothetical protein
MRSAPLAIVLALVMVPLHQPARACTIAMPHPPPTQAQIDGNMRRYYDGAAAVVEVVAIRGPSPGRAGQFRVTGVYKGNVRTGALISMNTLASSMCGAGEFAQGSRGIILLPSRGPYTFHGYLQPGQIAILRRIGRLPPR